MTHPSRCRAAKLSPDADVSAALPGDEPGVRAARGTAQHDGRSERPARELHPIQHQADAGGAAAAAGEVWPRVSRPQAGAVEMPWVNGTWFGTALKGV